MTEARVTATTGRRLLRRVARAQAEGQAPSLVAGVVRDGELAWSGGRGDLVGPVSDVQYRIGSITKTMTAVLVLQLVRDGVLALDTPVGDVLGNVGYGDRTVRALLAHDSGMQAEPTGPWWERSTGTSFADLAAANDGSGAVFADRSRFHYSNLGYALLGQAVAELTDGSWWEALEARVLRPLGMSRTTYLPAGPAAEGFSVHPYARTLTPEPVTDTGAMAPAGQVWSTVADLARWAAFLLDGHPDVLSSDALSEAATPQSGEPVTGLASAHGLGFALLPGGSGTLVGHTGSMPGFLAACFVDRPRRTGAMALANATTGPDPGALARGLLEELEECEPSLPEAWRPSPAPPPEIAEVLGVWHWGNTMLVLSWAAPDLVLSRRGVERGRFRLEAGRLVGTSGYHAGEELRVVRRPDGSVGHLDVATFIWTRVPYDPKAPIPGGHPAD